MAALQKSAILKTKLDLKGDSPPWWDFGSGPMQQVWECQLICQCAWCWWCHCSSLCHVPSQCAQPGSMTSQTHTHSPWIYAHHTLTLSAPYKIIADFLPSCTNSNQLKRFFPFIATYENTTGATPKCQENEQQFVIFAFMINLSHLYKNIRAKFILF